MHVRRTREKERESELRGGRERREEREGENYSEELEREERGKRGGELQ